MKRENGESPNTGFWELGIGVPRNLIFKKSPIPHQNEKMGNYKNGKALKFRIHSFGICLKFPTKMIKWGFLKDARCTKFRKFYNSQSGDSNKFPMNMIRWGI
jgi:hypothetical protein